MAGEEFGYTASSPEEKEKDSRNSSPIVVWSPDSYSIKPENLYKSKKKKKNKNGSECGEGDDDTKIRETYLDRTTTPYTVYWSLITQSLLLALHVSVQLCTRALRECASRQPRRRDGQVQVQRWLALLLLHGGDTARTGCRSPELLTDRARAVGVAARVLPQADRQREVAARLLLIRPPVGSSVTWLNRRLSTSRWGVTV